MFTKTILEQDYVHHTSHNSDIKYYFNKIDIKNNEKLVNLTICIELPHNIDWCENYKQNMLKTFKIVANNHFCFNIQDYMFTNQEPDRDDQNVYISIKPHDRFKFHMFIFENVYTELVLRPMAVICTDSTQTFRPMVKLLVDVENH